MLRNNADARRCSYFELGLPVVALSQFVRKKEANCFTTKFSQTILRNHLGFITTSVIKLCFMQRQG